MLSPACVWITVWLSEPLAVSHMDQTVVELITDQINTKPAQSLSVWSDTLDPVKLSKADLPVLFILLEAEKTFLSFIHEVKHFRFSNLFFACFYCNIWNCTHCLPASCWALISGNDLCSTTVTVSSCCLSSYRNPNHFQTWPLHHNFLVLCKPQKLARQTADWHCVLAYSSLFRVSSDKTQSNHGVRSFFSLSFDCSSMNYLMTNALIAIFVGPVIVACSITSLERCPVSSKWIIWGT